jgi:integrase
MTDKRRTKTSDPEIIVYPDGTHYFRRGSKEISLRTKDFKEAIRAKKVLLSKSTDVLASSLRIKIRNVKDDYIRARERDLKNGDIRPLTLQHTKKNMEIICRIFGAVAVAKMDSVKWESEKRKILGNHIYNVRSVLSHFMKWCVKNGYRNTLPIFDVGRIVRRKRRILKPHEMSAIWSHSEGSLRVFVAHAMILGMRRSEIMTLEWGQINFTDRVIFLPAAKTKTKRDRYVTIPNSVLEILVDRVRGQAAAGISTKWVFPHALNPSKPADRDGLKTAWHSCLRRAFNVPKGDAHPNITWHDLRATCEFYAHKRTDLSATQLEKFFGASVDVQRKIYVQGDAEFVRGVENSLSLPEVIEKNVTMGKPRGEEK